MKKNILFIILFALSITSIKCTFDPMWGKPSDVKIAIVSSTKNLSMNRNAITTTSTSGTVSQFTCLFVTATGLKIDAVSGDSSSTYPEVPISDLDIGYQNPMITPPTADSNGVVALNALIPLLYGVDSSLSKRTINIYGIIPSTYSSTSCVGDTLSHYLSYVDPYAQVFSVASFIYPTTTTLANCPSGYTCVTDSSPILTSASSGVKRYTTDYDLVSQAMAKRLATKWADESNGIFSIANFNGSTVSFSDKLTDYTGKTYCQINNKSSVCTNVRQVGIIQSQSKFNQSSQSQTSVARIDFYFPITTFELNMIGSISSNSTNTSGRVGSLNIQFPVVSSPDFSLQIDGSCSTPSGTSYTYTDTTLKIWNETTQLWENPSIGSNGTPTSISTVTSSYGSSTPTAHTSTANFLFSGTYSSNDYKVCSKIDLSSANSHDSSLNTNQLASYLHTVDGSTYLVFSLRSQGSTSTACHTVQASWPTLCFYSAKDGTGGCTHTNEQCSFSSP